MGDGYTTAAQWWVFLGLFGVYFIGYQWHRHLKGKRDRAARAERLAREGTKPCRGCGRPVLDRPTIWWCSAKCADKTLRARSQATKMANGLEGQRSQISAPKNSRVTQVVHVPLATTPAATRTAQATGSRNLPAGSRSR